MSSIHYFQRYSQKENVVTNNTLLLFSRLYFYNPLQLQRFLQEILKEDVPLEVGVSFQQQTKLKGSVPDGILTQTSFKIVIETKLYKSHDIKQVESHLDAFDKEDKKILLSLSPVEPPDDFRKRVNNLIMDYNRKINSNIIFACMTFEQIIFNLKKLLNVDKIPSTEDIAQKLRQYNW